MLPKPHVAPVLGGSTESSLAVHGCGRKCEVYALANAAIFTVEGGALVTVRTKYQMARQVVRC